MRPSSLVFMFVAALTASWKPLTWGCSSPQPSRSVETVRQRYIDSLSWWFYRTAEFTLEGTRRSLGCASFVKEDMTFNPCRKLHFWLWYWMKLVNLRSWMVINPQPWMLLWYRPAKGFLVVGYWTHAWLERRELVWMLLLLWLFAFLDTIIDAGHVQWFIMISRLPILAGVANWKPSIEGLFKASYRGQKYRGVSTSRCVLFRFKWTVMQVINVL